MILLKDKKKAVELFLENMLWGDTSFDLSYFNTKEDFEEYHKEIIDSANKWRIMFTKGETESKEFVELTNGLYGKFFRGRFYNLIKGKMRDREEEQTMKALKEQLDEAVARLSQAYIPPTKPQTGTG